MARPPRIEYEGAFYHVINRGIERRTIFAIADDYARFLDLCVKLKERYKVNLLAYCVMPNHYHLLLRTALANLHRYMKDLNGGYSKSYNRRCRRVGPLFQGRYKALLVQDDAYVLAVARYIHLNPVKAGMADHPEGYRWSSYREYLGKGTAGVADTSFLLGFFRGALDDRIRQFRRFTTEEHEAEYEPGAAIGGVVAGAGAFLEWVRKERIPRTKPEGMARWRELQKPAEAVKGSLERRVAALTEDAGLRRKLLAYALKKSTPLSLKEIAGTLGMGSIHAVSQTVRRLDMARRREKELDALLGKLDAKLRLGR